MNEIVILYKVSFDNMENNSSEAEYKTELGVFGPKPPLSPHGNCSEFIGNMKPTKHYLGWNGEIYPKFIMKKKYIQ